MDQNISRLVPSECEDGNIGPALLYETFGVTIVLVYTVLPVLISVLLLYSLYYRPHHLHPHRLLILILQLTPVLHLIITFPVLLSPATIPLVSILQDLIVMISMVAFVNFTLDIIGSLESVESPCPIGTPPLCCLICCRKPEITQRTARLILLPFKLTPVALVINLLINIYLTYSGVNGKIELEGFFNIDNIHNLLLIPFFISTMYCWKIFVSVTSPAMLNKNQRLRGFLLFSMFIFCKIVPTICAILSGKDIIPSLPCIPSIRVAALLVALIEMFYISVVAVVIPSKAQKRLKFPGSSSFSLSSLHSLLLGVAPVQSHGAEADCLSLLRVTSTLGQDWVDYLNNNYKPLTAIKPMWNWQ